MESTGALIAKLIKTHLARIRGTDIGVVTEVRAFNRVTIQLKHTVAGHVMEYLDVPVLPYGFGSGKIYAMPEVGDTVTLAFLQYSPEIMMEFAQEITEVNEGVCFTRPVVLTAVDTADAVPDIQPGEGELLISHKSGSYIRFKSDGSIIIASPNVNIIAPGDPE